MVGEIEGGDEFRAVLANRAAERVKKEKESKPVVSLRSFHNALGHFNKESLVKLADSMGFTGRDGRPSPLRRVLYGKNQASQGRQKRTRYPHSTC